MPAYGIVGNPVEQSLSPHLHGYLHKVTGHSGTYGRFLVEQDAVKDIIPAMKALTIRGVNVTSPHKQAIIPFLDVLSPEAKEIGAVNTIHIANSGSAVGYNTDCYGFAKSLLCAGIAIKGSRFLLCGLGGAGKAALYALREHGAAEIIIASNNPRNGIAYNDLHTLPDMDVIVNCTPLGMAARKAECPVAPGIFPKFKAAVDLIYNPAETLFLKTARECGLVTLNGLSMLVFQGIRSFEIWTGLTPPAAAADETSAILACILSEKQL